MVAKIKSGKSIIGAINYNEHKVKAGKAKLISAASYGKDQDLLCFNDKLFRLTDLAERNQRTKTNTVHLSLNFDVTERIPTERLIEIADAYMSEIGFCNQPYLVYQHFDAGHPHIHIVSTNIQPNGTRISLHNIGRLVSEPARKKIELDFDLVRADLKDVENKQILRSQIAPLEYGTTDTKRGITNVVNEIIRQYKFTSLAEFNAILKGYNIEADRGKKQSVMYDLKGLRYWPLDSQAKKLGVPIKASAIYKKPTLKYLEQQFHLGEFLRRPLKKQVKDRVDVALRKARTMEQFVSELKGLQIGAVIRENTEGRIYGVTFVDHKNKVVFNGSDLGGYSAAAIIAQIQSAVSSTSSGETGAVNDNMGSFKGEVSNLAKSRETFWDDLLSPTEGNINGIPFEQKKKKKKKKLKL
ncbi:relaxase/mobilization nuclease domain-containing protein [Mucilaginibacter sabulilitoris]|uniref:Relaxase/mobilization nuclease domain-containing protein n=1 Tax=Mucilaginibacter sabulilitoris TaxID=1173583 RepID=A0ABZ0TNW4_9SPHI|nr:relaxase/mobilization nuclease domain-containing protein [Mucilaginibacter sabulilitoris]WPU94829.1 relaxase/mobilization nuclease domain-containing protein [Mucilaginibacter sabulilitoris]